MGGVRLRDVVEDDLPTFYDHQLNPEAIRMAAFPPREWEAFMAHWARILRDETVTTQTILVDGQVAGNVVSFEQVGERHVGYWLGREFWGRGVATEALAQFLRHERTRPLCARVARRNVASIRVLRKCGFALSGGDEGSSRERGDDGDEVLLQFR